MASYELIAESIDEDFFRAGTDGSYANGTPPLGPVVLEEGDPPRVPDTARLARRARLTRAVTWAVAALSVFAVLAPLVHTLRAQKAFSSAEFQPLARAVATAQPLNANAPIPVALGLDAQGAAPVAEKAVKAVKSTAAATPAGPAHPVVQLATPKPPISSATPAPPNAPAGRSPSVARFPDPS